ncbi:hypothetical protein WOB59_00600 [Methylocystis sp. IM4]|uniref:hypothetical protein n=1 Tax=Methylocystis sp. IM4 TaxID=3136560 RepID=UPI0031195384
MHDDRHAPRKGAIPTHALKAAQEIVVLKWRRTSFKRLDGSIDVLDDDWSLSIGGRSLARIYLLNGGPQDGRWAWFVQVFPEGTPGNGGVGVDDDGRAAREACESLLPPAIQQALADGRKSETN